MLTMMGTEEMPITGTNTTLPRLHLKWSCQMSTTAPHSIAVADRSGHVATLSEMSPIQSRIVFWVANNESDVRVAPEGRYLDYVESKLTTSSAGGKTFMVPLPGYDATFTGRLVVNGSSYKLYDGEVIFGGSTPNTLSTKTLTPL